MSNIEQELDSELITELRELGKQNLYEEYLKILHIALKKVKTRENGEPLIYLPDNLDKNIFIELVDIKVPAKDEERLWLRKGIIERLNAAQKSLPESYHLLIRDAFRTEKMVWNLYNLYLSNLKEEKPNLTDTEAKLMIRNILAVPDDPVTPGHMTGGAIDLILADDNGQKIQLRTDEDLIPREEQDFTFCKKLSEDILAKRHILYDAMISVGFHNYFREFWHYSYGDAYWAVRRKDKTAIYGLSKIK
jgi:D-alanyl-D-alanine dipeptidase